MIKLLLIKLIVDSVGYFYKQMKHRTLPQEWQSHPECHRPSHVKMAHVRVEIMKEQRNWMLSSIQLVFNGNIEHTIPVSQKYCEHVIYHIMWYF